MKFSEIGILMVDYIISKLSILKNHRTEYKKQDIADLMKMKFIERKGKDQK